VDHGLTRRGFLRVAGAGTAAATLWAAGCGGDGGDEGGGSTTLEVWDYYGTPDTPYGKPLRALYDRFEREHPGVRINKRYVPFPEFNRTLLQSAAGGDLPDIALINAFDTGALAEAGVLQDLTPRIEEWGEQDQYFPTSWETTQYEGKGYGLPHVADCYVLWYNRAQLGGSEPPGTWGELGTLAAELATGNRHGIALSVNQGVEGATAWLIRFLAAGGDLKQPHSPAGEAALQQWVELVESGAMSRGVLGWSEEDVYNRFRTGAAAMMVNSATYVNTLRDEAPDLEWEVTLLPADQQRATFLSAENLTITTGSQSQDAAWDLLAYMQRAEVLNTYLPERNKLPARKDVAADPQWSEDPVWSVFVEQLPSAWAPDAQVAPKSAELLANTQAALQSAISGSSSVDAALEKLQGQADALLA
jgi:multiple sugar transport system substrate-binding protein